MSLRLLFPSLSSPLRSIILSILPTFCFPLQWFHFLLIRLILFLISPELVRGYLRLTSDPPGMSASLSPAQPVSQDSSGTNPPRPRNKRARPPISCLECRRKKLKCDRVQPCMQCKKGGREALCVFVNRPAGPSPQCRVGTDIFSQPNSRPRSELAAPIQPRDKEQDGGRMGWVANSSRPVAAIPERSHGCHGEHISYSSLGCIHVKGGRSRYLGIGDRMAMLGHVSISLIWHIHIYICILILLV